MEFDAYIRKSIELQERATRAATPEERIAATKELESMRKTHESTQRKH